MTDYTSKAFLQQFGLTCDSCHQVAASEIASGGALVLLKVEGFWHLYVDDPFDAYVLFVNHGDMNYGTEWFGTEETAEAEDAFKSRLGNNPNRAFRGTIAHDIGAAANASARPSTAPAIRP
ncbi:hypothetical protein OIU34_23565 [Pararhizobium sp. BT-229]|uniref:hypothetical protein n=1 Tax=Pararhizobium sp. BT-229 TaxID=2986923 RepID=UPI0021F6E331|nr:hypothetical protein [Pararhizobium sp. BT-229]MCV9964875.1 hypothetical protein [Pararhizobium sp. BT-229]